MANLGTNLLCPTYLIATHSVLASKICLLYKFLKATDLLEGISNVDLQSNTTEAVEILERLVSLVVVAFIVS